MWFAGASVAVLTMDGKGGSRHRSVRNTQAPADSPGVNHDGRPSSEKIGKA